MIEIFENGAIRNPLNEFIYSLPLEKCNDEKLDWLIKNLISNFSKLYGCSINIAQIQNDYLSKSKTNETLNLHMFSLNSIEYFFIKIGTIFDLCYQAFDILCESEKNQGKKKYEFLENEFNKYNEETNQNLHKTWFESINKVRNRVVHGGYSVKTFTEDGKFLFQVYDPNLDIQLIENYGFFKKDNSLIYIDFYTNFYTKVAHWYIEQFFHFILYKLDVTSVNNEELNTLKSMQKQSLSYLNEGFEDLFNEVSYSMKMYNTKR